MKTMKLVASVKFAVVDLVFSHFVDVNDRAVNHPEYSYLDWFVDGVYAGPDEDGIEPAFTVDSAANAWQPTFV